MNFVSGVESPKGAVWVFRPGNTICSLLGENLDRKIAILSVRSSFQLCSRLIDVRLQVMTEARMETTVFWVVAPCILVEVDRRFTHHSDDGHSNHL